jgi:hypothetical protein
MLGGDLVMIVRPCYCNRNDVKRALDFEGIAAIDNDRLDRALQTVADTIEGQLHRVFYPIDTVRPWDWPNFQYANPWRLWFDQWDLVAATAIESPPGAQIPLYQVFLRPVNRKPGFPFEWMEIDRSTTAAFTAGPTPQLSVWVTGTWGFTALNDPVATLAANVAAGDTTVTVSDSSKTGPGDLLILNPGVSAPQYPTYRATAGATGAPTGERVVVTGQAAAATGLTQSGAGCSAASDADTALTTTGTGTLNPGEVILLDQERMLVQEVVSGVAAVKRAWDGTSLATHTSSAVSAYRQLGVLRGQLGTTAASYTAGQAAGLHRVPSLVRDLALAETLNQALQETSGYARMVGQAETATPAPGTALSDKWDEARATYGRKARIRAI